MLVMANEALADTNAAACPDPRLRMLNPILGSGFYVGTEIEVLGTASYPDATRYQVEQRPLNSDAWLPINTIRRSTRLGQLATWDTTEAAPGVYEIRLTAVDRNNIRLPNSARCEIAIELVP